MWLVAISMVYAREDCGSAVQEFVVFSSQNSVSCLATKVFVDSFSQCTGRRECVGCARMEGSETNRYAATLCA